MNEQDVKDYILNNLTLEITEESFGFNGSHVKIKLMLENEVISEDYIDTKNDDG